MNKFDCDKEQQISKALRFGELRDELSSHAAGCAICTEVLEITGFLQ